MLDRGKSELSMTKSPYNLFVLFVKACLYVTVLKRSSRSGVVFTRSQQMVRGRRVVSTAKCRVRYRPNASGPITRIRAGEVQVECDIEIHGGATVTCCQYKQSAELEGRRRTGAERAKRTEKHESRARCTCYSSVQLFRRAEMPRQRDAEGAIATRDQALRFVQDELR